MPVKANGMGGALFQRQNRIGFAGVGGGSGRAGTEPLFIGSVEGGIIPKAAAFSHFDQAHASGNAFFCQDQPLFGQVVVDGVAGVSFEPAHKVIFTDAELFCQMVDGNGVRQMQVQIPQDPRDFFIQPGACDIPEGMLRQLLVDGDKKFQEERAA